MDQDTGDRLVALGKLGFRFDIKIDSSEEEIRFEVDIKHGARSFGYGEGLDLKLKGKGLAGAHALRTALETAEMYAHMTARSADAEPSSIRDAEHAASPTGGLAREIETDTAPLPAASAPLFGGYQQAAE